MVCVCGLYVFVVIFVVVIVVVTLLSSIKLGLFHFSSSCFSVKAAEGYEILLAPEVTYGPPGLDLSFPVAMTIAHCAEVNAANWNIQLKRQAKDNKWEVMAREGSRPTEVSLVQLYGTDHVLLFNRTGLFHLLNRHLIYLIIYFGSWGSLWIFDGLHE